METLYQLNTQEIINLTKDFQQTNRKTESLKLQKKWAKTGLLEGLDKNPQTREAITFILENQAKQVKRSLLTETTAVGDIAGFNKIVFPLVRRVFAQLLANNIVSVQPMSQPSGLVFFLDFTFERSKAGHTSGDSIYGLRDTVVSAKSQGIGGQTGQGGMYGYQELAYSSRDFVLSQPTNAAPVIFTGLMTTSLAVTGTLSGFLFPFLNTGTGVDTLARYRMYPTLSASTTLEGANAVDPLNPNYTPASISSFRSFLAVQSATPTYQANVDRMLTTLSGSTGVIVYSNVDLTAAGGTGGTNWLVGGLDTLVQDSASTNGASMLLGDFETTIQIPQINAKILSTFVMSQSKRLRTVWTPEMAQDLNAYMSLDAEVELTNVLSEEIAAELDREIIADLVMIASVKAAWSRRIGRYLYVDQNGKVNDASSAGSTFQYQAFHGTQDDWNNTLGHVASAVSNRIYKLNLRHGANWIITGMQISSIIEGMGKQFVGSEFTEETMQYSFGTTKVGTLSGRWQVYKDPFFPEDLMLMGYKGGSALESGYIWCPYIPLIVTPTIFDPTNFSPIKGVMTRNGKTTIRPDFYGTLKVFDLGFYTFSF